MRTEPVEARKWIESGKYQLPYEIPERMPNIQAMYNSGAELVEVEYDPISEHMELTITFHKEFMGHMSLWMFIANCDHDGIRKSTTSDTKVIMTILGPDEHINSERRI